jgi:hypothetical protein
MLKCPKCGIEYPSETSFHRGDAEGPRICLSCFQASGGSPQTGPTPKGEKAGVKVSKGGLIVATFLFVMSVVVVRDPHVGLIAVTYFTAALALAIRSFFPEMTFGRGFLTTLGGLVAGTLLVFVPMSLSSARSFEAGLGSLIGFFIVALFGFASLRSGFRRGKIQWRGKKA